MARFLTDKTLLWVSILLITIIFLIEASTPIGIVGTVAYVLVVLLFLWLSGKPSFSLILGIVTTVYIIYGFVLSTLGYSPTLSMIFNRTMAGFTVWISIYYSIRFKDFLKKELFQKQYFNAIFENTTEGMLVTDERGKIVSVNKQAELLFGYPRAELIGQTIEKLVPHRLSDRHEKGRQTYQGAPHNKSKNRGYTLYGMRKNGAEFPVEISLSTFNTMQQVFTVAFVTDITDRKQKEALIADSLQNIQNFNEELEAHVNSRTQDLADALIRMERSNQNLQAEIAHRKEVEEKLLQSQQLYTAIAQNFPDGIIGVLDCTLKLVFINGKELSRFNLSPQSLLNTRFTDMLAPELPPHIEKELLKVAKGQNINLEIKIKTEQYNLLAVPLPLPRGVGNEILVVMQNITARKCMEESLRKALEKEKELGVLKSRFVTAASHEFRTPLSTILSSAFLLECYQGEQYNSEKLPHLNRIKRAVHNLTGIINDFITIGRLEEGKVDVVQDELQLNSFIQQVLSEVEVLKKPGQTIVYKHLGNNTPVIFTDKQLLRNILFNLLTNAIKYSPADGKVEITTKTSHNELFVSIQDNGIGIPKEEYKHLFKRFFRAKNATNIEGTGLGLNIVRKYIKLLKGTIHFKSEIGKGTVFKIKLPVHVQQPDPVIN
jgi:PAS domain S-box-containing protein